MSESQDQVSYTTLPDKATQFPASWLVEYPEAVADLTLWNQEGTPVHSSNYFVDWPIAFVTPYFLPDDDDVAIGPTFIRHYFGLPGCVIPIAANEASEKPAIFFIFAGPADEDGNKQFFAYFHDHDAVEDIKLCRAGRFASVAEFYREAHVDGWCKPVEGGQDAAQKELDKCGYRLPED